MFFSISVVCVILLRPLHVKRSAYNPLLAVRIANDGLIHMGRPPPVPPDPDADKDKVPALTRSKIVRFTKAEAAEIAAKLGVGGENADHKDNVAALLALCPAKTPTE